MVDEAGVTEHVARIADAFAERAADLTADVVTVYVRELPNLVYDDESVVNLLSASLLQNLDTVLRVFRHGIDPTRVQAPAAAIEYARRLAQRGTPVNDLVRAYFLAQSTLLARVPGEAARQPVDQDVLCAIIERFMTGAFAFIDRVTQQVVSAYQDERDRWLLNRSAVQAARVRELLAGGRVDIDDMEKVLTYRLRGLHLAAILWLHGTSSALSSLESVTKAIAAQLPMSGSPLVVPADEYCSWVWFPLRSPTLPDENHTQQILNTADTDVHIALGDPGDGIAGFRSSHHQASRVHALATAAGEHAERCLTFRNTGALALMASDLPAARSWVTHTLGKLAAEDDQHRRLRQTLLAFLTAGSSYTAAATLLTIHKNSVQYRIRKAEEALGRPITDSRLELELALKLCQYLGKAVIDV